MCFLLPARSKVRFLRRVQHGVSHFAFVFLTGSCDRRQAMSTKARETKKVRFLRRFVLVWCLMATELTCSFQPGRWIPTSGCLCHKKDPD